MSPDSIGCPSSRTSRRLALPRSALVRLAAPLGGTGEDASPRHLQSTYDTSTRQSLDDRARGFRRVDPMGCAHPLSLAAEASSSNVQCLPRGVGPSCDNPTPVGLTLDSAGPASACRDTVFRLVFSRSAWRRGTLSGAHPTGALSSPMKLRDRPLTPPVVSAMLRFYPETSETRTAFHRPLVNASDFVRSETPSIDRCSLESAFARPISDR